VCQRSSFTSLFGIRNTGSSDVTPQSSTYEEDSGLEFGVYLPEGLYVGNDKGLFESDLLVSCEGG
jgi:hypothetical protein